MSADWKTVRVFISSTFRDMQAERDHLVRFVFPQLREELIKRHIHLVDVDLRWGVTSEQDVLDICREIIDECRPRFICILGGRYGWIPPGESQSITASEIQYAALNRAQVREYHYFYFRDPRVTASIPEEVARTQGYRELVLEEDVERLGREQAEKLARKRDQQLETLKSDIVNAGFHPFIYLAKWQENEQRLVDLHDFGEKVRADIIESINDEFGTEPPPIVDDLDEENAAMEAFAEERVERYVNGSRQTLLDELNTFAQSAITPNIMVFTGESGLGKSALLSKFYRDYSRSHPDDLIIPCFIGASTGSTDVRRLLFRCCRIIYTACGFEGEKLKRLAGVSGNNEEAQKKIESIEKEFEITSNSRDLNNKFNAFLKKAAAVKRVVLLIDGLNQLDAAASAHSMEWLPRVLPENVRVVLSSLEHPALDVLRREPELIHEIRLQPLNEEDSRRIISVFLQRYHKQMTPEQVVLLMAKPARGNPLYLRIALDELRTLSNYAEISQRLQVLPGDVRSLFLWVLKERLSNDPGFRDQEGRLNGKQLVRRVVSSLGVSRYGLSQQELTELIEPGDPLGNVAALQHLLRPYLMQRGELLDFFHGQLRQAVEDEYLDESAERIAAHCELAAFFQKKADPEANKMWHGKDLRGFSELPYHQVSAELWLDVESTLSDLRFVNAKCAAGMTFDLVNDYALVLDALPETNAEKQVDLARSEQAVKYTQTLIAFAKGESASLEPVPSIMPWEDDQIGRYVDHVANHPTRLNRIMAFAQFVNSESYNLTKFSHLPGFCYQQAYNSARSGLVAECAQKIVDNEPQTLLLLNAPAQRPPYHPHPALLRTLEGHGERGASSVAMMREGKRAVSSGFDRTLRVWDLETGECTRVLEGHTSWIEDMQVTPDGKLAVSGGEDTLLRIWDLERGDCLKVLKGHTKRINGVAISADGRRVVSGTGGEGACLMVWDVPSGKCVRVIEGCSGEGIRITADGRIAVIPFLRKWDLETGACLLKGDVSWMNSVDITPDGKRAVSGGADGELLVWNLEDGRCLKTLKGHTRWIKSVSITPDGKLAISGGGDMALRFWDLEAGRCIRTLGGHTGAINCVNIWPNGSRAITAAEDQTIRLWDLEKGESIHVKTEKSDWIENVGLTVDGRFAISSSSKKSLLFWGRGEERVSDLVEKNRFIDLLPDGKKAVSWGEKLFRLWDVPGEICIKVMASSLLDHDYIGVAAPDGKRLYLAGSVNFVGGVDLENGSSIDFKRHMSGGVRGVSLMSDGKRALWAGSSDICVWDLETGRSIKTLQEGFPSIFGLSTTPDGRKAVIGGFEKIFYVWDVVSGTCLSKLAGHTGLISSVGITPDGVWGISGGDDGSVRVWDTVLAKCVRVLEGHTDRINCVAISADGRKAISGGNDRLVLVWDVIRGKCIHRLAGHVEPPNGVCISKDGNLAVSGARDCAILVWNLRNGKCIHTLRGHAGFVNSVAITADGKRLVSGSADKTIKVWDLSSGRCVRTLEGHTDVVSKLSITPDGRKAMSCGYDEIFLWDLESGACIGSVEHSAHDNYCLDITPDDKRPISGGYRGYTVWDVDARDWIRTFRVGKEFHSMKVTPDGRRLVTGDYDTSVGVWNIRNGERLHELKAHAARVGSISISQDGKTIVSGCWDKTILVWNIESGECMAAYQARCRVTALSAIHINGRFAFGTETGEVTTILPRNFPSGIPIVTAVRFWQNNGGGEKSGWEKALKAMCPACSRQFEVSGHILRTIREINLEYKVTPGQSPCFELPDQAWEQSDLLSTCPNCGQQIRFNPFVVDNQKHN